jgi:hypothetical protein
MIRLGYQLVTLASDNALLANMAKSTVAQMREGLPTAGAKAGVY